MIRLSDVLLALAVLAPMPAEAQPVRSQFCRFPPIRFCDGCVVNRPIQVRIGGTCVFSSHSPGQLLGQETLTPPRLGVFGKANVAQAAYRAGSTPGRDYFEYRQRWERLGRTNAVTIRNHVTVVP